MRQIVFLLAVIASFMPTLCSAAESRISVPLWGNLILPQAAQDWLPSVNDWIVVRGMNEAFGDGFQVHLTDQKLLIRFDTDKLPADWDNWCDALGRFTVVAAPKAVARQNQRFGLHLPVAIDPRKPLVILIHGMDGDRGCCEDVAKLLNRDNFQTAFFAYPAERPLAESAELFSRSFHLDRPAEFRLELDAAFTAAQAGGERMEMAARFGVERGLDDHRRNLPGRE
jgi:hypothetical protein